MRDPAVLAVFALRVTAAEFAALVSGAPIVRLYWPPVPCRGSVVGLHVGEVIGEALLSGVVAVAGGAADIGSSKPLRTQGLHHEMRTMPRHCWWLPAV